MLELTGMALKGVYEDNFSKQMLSKVFDLDPQNPSPVERLVGEAIVKGLTDDDIDEIFRRFAKNKGLDY